MLLARETSNWTSNWTSDVILPSLTEVRIYLQKKKMYSEAQSVLQTEILTQEYAGSSSDNPYENFLEATAHLDLCNDEATLIKLAQARLDYAEQLVGLKKYEAARAQLLKSKDLMQRASRSQLMSLGSTRSLVFYRRRAASARTQELSKEYPKLMDQLRKCFFLMTDDLPLEEKKKLNDDLVDCAMASGDKLQYRSHLLTAYDLSLPADIIGWTPHNSAEFQLIVNKIIDLDENNLRLAYHKSNFLNRYATDCSNQPKEELKEILELFQKFEKEHTKFELPSKCRSMAVRCAQLNHALGDEKLADFYFAQVEFWTRHSSVTENKQALDGNMLKNMFNDELFEAPFHTSRTWYHFILLCCYLIIKCTEVIMQSTIHPIPNIDQLLCLKEDTEKENDLPWWKLSVLVPSLNDPPPTYSNDDVSLTLPATLMERVFGGQNPRLAQHWDSWFAVLQATLFKGINGRQGLMLLVMTQMCRIWKLLSHADQVPSDGKKSFDILLLKECEVVLRLAKDMTQRHSGDSLVLGKATSMIARATIRMVLGSDMIDGENKSGSYFSRAVDHFYLASKSFDQNAKLFAPTLDVYAITLGLAYAELGKQRNSKDFNASVVLSCFSEADSTYQRYRLSKMLWIQEDDLRLSNLNAIYSLPTPEQYSGLAITITTRGLSQRCPVSQDGLLNLTDKATIYSAKELIEEATKWTQKVKTRPLENLLHDHIDLPGYVLPKSLQNAEVMRTWSTRKDFYTSGPAALPDPKLSCQLRDFYNHEATVKSLAPDLSPYLSLYEASRANPKELRLLMESWGPSVVMLVYIEARSPEYDWLVFMYRQTQLFCVAPIRTLKARQLGVHLDDLDVVLKLFGTDKKKSTIWRNTLRPLVEPMQGWVKSKDSLIICPPPSLYRVPFHLLSFSPRTSEGDIPLFKSHTVTYAQTFSLLKICQLSQQDNYHRASNGTNTSVQQLPHFEEHSEHSKHISNMEITTRSLEINKNRGKCSIYLYGQNLGQSQHPASHVDRSISLELSFLNLDGVSPKELLKLRFPCRPSILFMTRDWPEYEKNDDNEHLAQIAALHISGAGSIISTLRPVPEGYREQFLNKFRQILTDTITNNIANAEKVYIGKSPEYVNDDWVTTCFINLAQILQKTIISLIEKDEDDQVAADRWAVFVLHGAHKIGLVKKQCT